MTLEIVVVLLIVLAALVVFALELLTVDFVAFSLLGLLLALSASGVLSLSLHDALSGFSNPATITVLAMFILSGGVNRTGAIAILSRRVIRLAGNGELRQLAVIMLVVGPISMFINNTAAVAILIPLVLRLARERKRSPSRLLIPLSFTSQLAGVVTLIGTSTNILASSISEDLGIGAFGMFEFARIGLLVCATGVAYLLLFGRHLLPRGKVEAAEDRLQSGPFLCELRVDGAPHAGRTLAATRIREDLDLDVLEIVRAGQRLEHPLADRRLETGDVLLVRAESRTLVRAREAGGLSLAPGTGMSGANEDTAGQDLMEVIVSPGSSLIGQTLSQAGFDRRYGLSVLAIRRRGAWTVRPVWAPMRERLRDRRLGFGDTLLVRGDAAALDRLKLDPNFIVTEELTPERFRLRKIPVALAIVAGVVGVAALGIQPILVTAVEGCVLMVLTGCLTPKELHESIRWDVILLLAGVIPLGIAFEKSGAAEMLAGFAVRAADHVPSVLVLWIFYFFAMVLTELISNNATVVLMVPIAAVTGQALGIDPKALMFCVMFAASTSFSTPVGYQTNTMVYGPGGYRFLDFTRIGTPLNLLLWLVTPLFVAWVMGIR